MPVRNEIIATPYHTNSGEVMCMGGGCYKDPSIVHQIHHGYGETDPLTFGEILELNQAADRHEQQFNNHDIRVIIFESTPNGVEHINPLHDATGEEVVIYNHIQDQR